MNEELCVEVRHRIEEKLSNHEDRLNEHSSQLSDLQKHNIENGVRIDNLCVQLSSLVTTLRWFIGLLIGGFVGFFFYAAQKGLLK